MHGEARDFTLFVKSALREYFIDKKVLDVGSGDINGNNRFLFENCSYEGNDVIHTKNVTIVSKTKDLPFEDGSFDTIISTECFEHDPEYKLSLLKIYKMLRPDGLFCFTCASTGRNEHGTRRTSPQDSYGTLGNLPDMVDYYKNLTELDLGYVLNLNEMFSSWSTYYHVAAKDLYFIGVKKGVRSVALPEYIANNVRNTTRNVIDKQTVEDIFVKYDTDKNRNFHNYSRQYEKLFRDFRDASIKYLEIGVYNGGSIQAMREVFKNSTRIVGLDIDAQCVKYEDVNANIYVDIGDATDKAFIDKVHSKHGSFDIILDDGSHLNRDVIRTFEAVFPLLNDNGVYIVEDTICYKSPSHMDTTHENHLEYFYKYTKFLNQWRYDSTEGVKDHCIDPFKIQKKTSNIFEYSIDKIEYGCSYIAIYKKVRTHWIQ